MEDCHSDSPFVDRDFCRGDGEIYQNEREFSRITIKTKSLLSTDFDTVVYDLRPSHPYVLQEQSSRNALLTNVVFATPIAGQYFRAEFVNFVAGRGYDGPRVIELDGFGQNFPIAEIIEQPKSQKVNGGSEVSFSIKANAPSELSYQWFHNSTPLQGATNSSLVLPMASQADAGQYSVELSNSQGIQTSLSATLEVVIADITEQPRNIQATEGSTASFTVLANSASEIKYQWFVNNSILPNATNSTLTLTNVSPGSRGSYYVVVSTQWGRISSDRAILTVLPRPRIFSQPASQQVDEGATVQFHVFALSETPVYYQWYFDGAPISRETNSTLTLVNVKTNASGPYYVDVTNAGGTVSSLVATLVVRPLPVTSFRPSSNDVWDVSKGAIVTRNSDVGFGTSAEDMFGARHDSVQPDATLFSDFPPDAGIHFVEWQTTDPVTISSFSIFAAGDGEIYLNEREFGRVTIKAKSSPTSGYDRLIYDLVPQHPYIFQEAASALLTNVILQTAINAQFFRAEFAHYVSGRGFDGPRILELDAFGVPHLVAEITRQPINQTVPFGSGATFSVTAISTNTLNYQWFFNGKIISGETNPVLTLPNVTLASRGIYFVELSDSAATIISSPAILEVLPPIDHTPPILVVTSPTNLTTALSDRLILSGTVTDNVGLPTADFDLNGNDRALLPLQSDGTFSIEISGLVPGANVLTIRAVDTDGNATTNSVVVSFTPTVSVIINGSGSYQEGSQITLPVIMSVNTDISGATFRFLYDTNLLADGALAWNASIDGAFKLINVDRGEINAAFALAGMTMTKGEHVIGELTFRARSVPSNTNAVVNLDLVDVYDFKGDSVTMGLFTKGASAQITRRKILGDNNGNDRLDIGDASQLLRFVTHVDPIQSWDISENDLNGNANLDSGDVIKVLRAVVGLDPQPDPTKSRFLAKTTSSGAGLGATFGLSASKPAITSGDMVTIRLEILNNSESISGSSFQLLYPTNALRLISPQSLHVGPIVPNTAAVLWNVSPAQTDFLVQDGSINVGISTANPWDALNGILAEFNFRVQAGAANALNWPITVRNGELASGLQVESIVGTQLSLQGRSPVPISFVKVESGGVVLRLEGEIGKTFGLEYSSDLRIWTPVLNGTVTLSNGTATVLDSSNGGADYRFYRVVDQTQ